MGIDGASERVLVIAPNRPQEFAPKYRRFSTFYQIAEELQFTAGKINGFSIPGYFSTRNVYADGTKFVDTLSAANRNSSQQRLDAGNEFGRLKRLGHVVVRSQVEPYHFVNHLIADSQHQDGRRHSLLPNFSTDVESVADGQHDVKNDKVKWQISGFPQCFLAINGSIQNVAFRTKTNSQCGSQRLFVFDQQYMFIHFSTPSSLPRDTLPFSPTAFPTGRCSVKVLPTPTSLVTDSLPPIDCAIRAATVSPKPVPCIWVSTTFGLR